MMVDMGTRGIGIIVMLIGFVIFGTGIGALIGAILICIGALMFIPELFVIVLALVMIATTLSFSSVLW